METVKYRTFEEVSVTNYERARIWHPKGLVDPDWTFVDWSNAMAGEAGEVCNAVKKHKRVLLGLRQAMGPHTEEEAVKYIAKEIGDVYLYLDLLAQSLGLSVEECVVDAFNQTSEKEGFSQRL